MSSILYWHPFIYRIFLRFIYGKSYSRRYLVLAHEIGDKHVLDLCCGDCKLADYVPNYTGIDLNDNFVKHAKMRGINVIKLDVVKDDIPYSECIVMLSGLCQFRPFHDKIL
jgi:hypothetical protein